MDRLGADYFNCVNMLIENVGANPLVLQLPIGAEDSFQGVVDLVKMKAVVWTGVRVLVWVWVWVCGCEEELGRGEITRGGYPRPKISYFMHALGHDAWMIKLVCIRQLFD